MRKKAEATEVIPLRVPQAMKTRIVRAAKELGLGNSDIMRLSIERGIGAVEEMFRKQQKKAA